MIQPTSQVASVPTEDAPTSANKPKRKRMSDVIDETEGLKPEWYNQAVKEWNHEIETHRGPLSKKDVNEKFLKAMNAALSTCETNSIVLTERR